MVYNLTGHGRCLCVGGMPLFRHHWSSVDGWSSSAALFASTVSSAGCTGILPGAPDGGPPSRAPTRQRRSAGLWAAVAAPAIDVPRRESNLLRLRSCCDRSASHRTEAAWRRRCRGKPAGPMQVMSLVQDGTGAAVMRMAEAKECTFRGCRLRPRGGMIFSVPMAVDRVGKRACVSAGFGGGE